MHWVTFESTTSRVGQPGARLLVAWGVPPPALLPPVYHSRVDEAHSADLPAQNAPPLLADRAKALDTSEKCRLLGVLTLDGHPPPVLHRRSHFLRRAEDPIHWPDGLRHVAPHDRPWRRGLEVQSTRTVDRRRSSRLLPCQHTACFTRFLLLYTYSRAPQFRRPLLLPAPGPGSRHRRQPEGRRGSPREGRVAAVHLSTNYTYLSTCTGTRYSRYLPPCHLDLH